jgi:hypothetical protein
MNALIVTLLLFPLVGIFVVRRGWGEAWLMGLGLCGSLMFVAGVFSAPAAAVAVLVLFLSRVGASDPWRRTERYPRAATILTIIPLVAIAFVATTIPLRDYDGRAFWLLKAKGIAFDRSVEGPFFRGEEVFDPRSDYPLLMPLNASLAMRAVHQLDDRHVRLLYFLTFATFVFMLRERLARFVSVQAGAWCAALLAWLPQFLVAPEGGVTSAYCDIALAAFVAGAFFELLANESPQRFGLWLTFLILTKNEGLPFAIVLLVAGAFVFRRRVIEALAAPTMALLTLAMWRHDIPASEQENVIALLPTLPQKLDRLVPALRALIGHAGSFAQWGVFWIAMILATCKVWAPASAGAGPAEAGRHTRLATAVIAAMLAVYVAVYTITSWVQSDLINSSADRLLMHFAGPALFLIASAAFPARSASVPLAGRDASRVGRRDAAAPAVGTTALR